MSNVQSTINTFFTTYPRRTYPKGQILVFADENPEYIFYVTRGKVRMYDVSYRGDEIIVNVFSKGAFFPMSWAINRSGNKYFYKTEMETELHIVPADDAVAFIKDNPDVMFDLLSRIYRGLDGLTGRIVNLMAGTAKSRLIYELIVECRRFGTPQPDDAYKLDTNEVDLAARSGLSRETVSREMHKLKANGWITITGKSICITDLSSLERSLGTEV